MSGIEVAGLVLGAIPVVVSGLQACAAASRTIRVACNYSQELEEVSRELRTEDGIFRNTIEILLSDCLDGQALADTLRDIGGKDWKDADVEAAVTTRLKRDYDLYWDNVRSMDSAMTKFKQRLKLGTDGKVKPLTPVLQVITTPRFNADRRSKPPFKNDPRSFQDAYRRLRFSLDKTAYRDLLQDIHRANTDLIRLTQQNIALEQTRTRAVRRCMPDFESVRSHACSLFRTLQLSLPTTCRASHRVSLCMEGAEASLGTKAAVTSGLKFRVVLHHDMDSHAANPMLWSIREAEVRPLGLCPSYPAKDLSTAVHGPATRTQGKQLRSGPFGASTKTNSSGSSLTKRQASGSTVEIKDMCACIQTPATTKWGRCVGYLVDTSNFHRHELYWPAKPMFDRHDFVAVSLSTILAENGHPGHRLTVGDSRKLAMSLAAGMLRLYETPWLAKQWGRHEVTLFQRNGSLLTDYPFVSSQIQVGASSQSGNADSASYFSPSIYVQNETLFALGIVLIELCLGQPFDAMMLPTEVDGAGAKHSGSDFLAATRLLDDVRDRAGIRYYSAARHCILCDFEPRRGSLQNDQFRKAVYGGVVSVLEEDVRLFFGEPS
ncbi:hypothetical protein LTR85_002012 [Meristemomyces frigidus]|nr:hypothetical protein LTR85_002012 [Meristemomyces frigidus]